MLFPFTLTQSVSSPQGAQEFSVVIKDIKINLPLKAEDFNQVLDRISRKPFRYKIGTAFFCVFYFGRQPILRKLRND